MIVLLLTVVVSCPVAVIEVLWKERGIHCNQQLIQRFSRDYV